MDSPRIHGDAEEKSSCESGWTMYIEDTFHGNNHHSGVVYDDEDEDDDHYRVKKDDDDESSDDGSDDSMTSDASSWPSTQLPRNNKNHAAAKNGNAKQVNRQTENRVFQRFRDDDDDDDQEEESELKARTRTRTTQSSRVQSKGKVSKKNK